MSSLATDPAAPPRVTPKAMFKEAFVMPRELIDTGTDKRYVRRDENGQFKESDDVGRASAADQKRDSKTRPKRGEGDRGDR